MEESFNWHERKWTNLVEYKWGGVSLIFPKNHHDSCRHLAKSSGPPTSPFGASPFGHFGKLPVDFTLARKFTSLHWWAVWRAPGCVNLRIRIFACYFTAHLRSVYTYLGNMPSGQRHPVYPCFKYCLIASAGMLSMVPSLHSAASSLFHANPPLEHPIAVRVLTSSLLLHLHWKLSC